MHCRPCLWTALNLLLLFFDATSCFEDQLLVLIGWAGIFKQGLLGLHCDIRQTVVRLELVNDCCKLIGRPVVDLGTIF